MRKSTILEIASKEFDFESFVGEIGKNLEEVIEPAYIITQMRPSNIEEGVYVDLDWEPIESFSPEDIENKIFYIKFIIDQGMWCEDGYICGDGSAFPEEGIDYGELVNYENGFIVLVKDGMISINKATYGKANPFQDVARLVDNAGDFESIMKDFVEKFIINI